MLSIVMLSMLTYLQQPSEAAGVSFSSLSTNISTNKQIIVDTHNNFRRNVSPKATNMLKMMWSDEVGKIADNWAKKCNLQHSPQDARKTTNFNCGENLFMSSSPVTWEEAITNLHSEIKDFQYGTGAKTTGAVIGHYTQIVWYNSYLIGASVAYCPNAELKYFYVFNFCPAGNMANQIPYPYKSGQTCADCPNSCDNGLCTNFCPYSNAYGNCPQLKDQLTCTHPLVRTNCLASCKCVNNEII
ncbi:hypothetical protein GDO86_010556 [Hymenochirus boettgeri]|uniref:ShKT domain-containing protein n=1 Tax=Hymenochirus boettgeri TaxID=247094 RepID=A0A8T2JNI5_9PIPI|nr:hypothetical protein GDO86_010556 [Hymenochirus boettgeri]